MNAVTNQSKQSGRNKLWAFHIGAAADAIVGIGLVAFAGSIAPLIMPAHEQIGGVTLETILTGLGVFLILFAIETVLTATSQGALARFRSWVVAANWATVALVVVLLATANAMFSTIGLAAVAVIGAFVATVTTLQQHAL